MAITFVCDLGRVAICADPNSFDYRGIYYWDGTIVISYPAGPVDRVAIAFILLHEIAHRIQDVRMGGLGAAEFRINHSGFRDNSSDYYSCQTELSASKYAVRKLRQCGVPKKRIASMIESLFEDDGVMMVSRLGL